jgi:hypothetical protein
MNTEPAIIFQESIGLLGQLAVGKRRYRTKHEFRILEQAIPFVRFSTN